MIETGHCCSLSVDRTYLLGQILDFVDTDIVTSSSLAASDKQKQCLDLVCSSRLLARVKKTVDTSPRFF